MTHRDVIYTYVTDDDIYGVARLDFLAAPKCMYYHITAVYRSPGMTFTKGDPLIEMRGLGSRQEALRLLGLSPNSGTLLPEKTLTYCERSPLFNDLPSERQWCLNSP